MPPDRWLLLAAVLAVSSAPAAPARSAEAVAIGGRRELFVDQLLIAKLTGAALKLHEPVPAETAIKSDRPWEGPFSFGQSVFCHRDLYYLYYRGMGTSGPGVICCATSPDGIRWTKPNLGAALVAGSRENNVLGHANGEPVIPNMDVFLDENPKTPDAERIKGTYYLAGGKKLNPTDAGSGRKQVAVRVSADGARFREMQPQPALASPLRNAFDSENVFFWSAAEGAYAGYFRFWPDRRSVARTTSKDFLTWTEPVPMSFGDTPPEQIYTNGTTPYFRAPHIYVALAGRFLPDRQALSDAQIKDLKLATLEGGGGVVHKYDHDCADGVLMTSRAGTARYDRTFLEAFIRPGPGANNWVSRTNWPAAGVVQTGPTEMSIYVNRHYAHESWHVQRLRLRLDGFASVNAPYAGGELLTKPLTFTGRQLEINYATSAAGSIRVELQDAGGQPLPGFALADGPELVGDEIARTVAWKGGDLAALAGKPVRLRFAMRDADLYALRFF